jgi:glycogen debranching enzyme
MMEKLFGWGDLVKIRPRPETVQLSRGRTSLVSGYNGMIHDDRPMEGLYLYNTRFLGRYEWLLNGKSPVFSCGSNLDQHKWMSYFILAPENCKETPAEKCEPLEETLELRLTRTVGEGLHEDVHVTNHTQVSTPVKLELQFELQFIAQQEVEEGRKQHGDLKLDWKQTEQGQWDLTADYRAEHAYSHQGNEGVAHIQWGTRLHIENATTAPQYSDGKLVFEAELPPHGEWHACLTWLGYREGRPLPAPGCPLDDNSEYERLRTQLLVNSTAEVAVPHGDDLTSAVGRVLNRSRLDLVDLRLYDLDTPQGVALAAGVPTYQEVFGRDMQAASWQAAMLSPDFLKGSLEALRKRMTMESNDWRDMRPGGLPHEIHTDPLSELNFKPTALYYGTASAAYLFPICVSELWHWTGDLNLVSSHADAAMKAIEWADKNSLDETGFYRYKTRSEQGVKNQGWKDSSDAIVYPDGSQVQAPIGMCEMQAFMYVAKLHFSEVMATLGHLNTARKLFAEARDLRDRFNEKFWMDDEGYFAMGIDPRGDLIRTVASDPGHCLLSGIVDESRVKQVANRMMREDMFSGWGVRTLSTENPAFNPFAYHRGTVWPVTNAGFVLAFSRYGLHGEMHQLARAMFEAACLFEHFRLPEVFAGHQRTRETPFPGVYTEANWPQAWSASAVFTMLQALVGIYPFAPAKILFLDPHLPAWLPEVKVERLRVGKAWVTLRFYRTPGGATHYEVLDQKGTLHMVRQPSPWSQTSGWRERIREAVGSAVSSGGKVA